jgi:hypothetical protein
VLAHEESGIVHEHWWRLKETMTLQAGRRVARSVERQNCYNCAHVCLKTGPNHICDINYLT